MNEEISGYSIIGSVILPDHSGTRLILGESFRDDKLVYVVATAPSDPCDEWNNGRYFDGHGSRNNRADAYAEYLRRLTEALA